MKEMKYVSAMKDFFGYRPSWAIAEGTTPLMDFQAELKKLNPGDKEEFKKGLEQNGYKIIE